MTVLVTGATGLVGNNVVRGLLDAHPGEPVRCLLRASADPRPLADLNVEIATGDITDRMSLDRAMDGVDRVVHAAADVRIGWSGADAMHVANVEGTANVAGAARDAGARMVHVSSADTLRGGPVADIPYVATKREAERRVLTAVEAGLDAVIVNPAFVLGPNDWKPSSGRVLLAAASGWVPFAPRGDLGLCDVRDVADVIIAALGTGDCGASHALFGHRMTWLQALRLFARAGGRWPPICRFDPVAWRAVGLAGDMIGRLTGREPAVNSAAIRLAGQRDLPGGAKKKPSLETGLRPVEITIADAWSWFQAQARTQAHAGGGRNQAR
ncbi:MAG: NAD-dependent epimerase/dehydratase family protein [Rhizobiaceae bacterium]